MLFKVWTGPARIAAVLVVGVAFWGGTPAAALPHGAVSPAPGISVVAEGGSERWIVDLSGVLVAALSPELAGRDDGLLLLVRPPRQPDGPRRLVRLRLEPEPRLDLLADGLGGWVTALAAIEAGAGPELVAGGPGRLVTLGPLPDLVARAQTGGGAERPLEEGSLFAPAGFDLLALDPGRLHRGVASGFAALEPGRLRLWQAGGNWTKEFPLPLAVARSASGLRLSSPPVARVRSDSLALLLAGPEAVGGTRLRSLLIDAGESGEPPRELWAALPGPESVSQSWPFEIDGLPVLVVRTQAADELNLFERQRLRVLILTADRTRSGALPTLAVELDSKRWHETAVALGDVDGDGRDDLLAAFPEGISGTDLVVQWWRGAGGGRFESRAHRSDLQKAPSGWALVATPRPGLLLVGSDRIELRSFAPSGRAALAERAELAASIPALPVPDPTAPATPKNAPQVTVSVGAGGESTKVVNVEPDAEPLGAVELDGRPGAELLAVQGSGSGKDRLILLRSRPD